MSSSARSCSRRVQNQFRSPAIATAADGSLFNASVTDLMAELSCENGSRESVTVGGLTSTATGATGRSRLGIAQGRIGAKNPPINLDLSAALCMRPSASIEVIIENPTTPDERDIAAACPNEPPSHVAIIARNGTSRSPLPPPPCPLSECRTPTRVPLVDRHHQSPPRSEVHNIREATAIWRTTPPTPRVDQIAWPGLFSLDVATAALTRAFSMSARAQALTCLELW